MKADKADKAWERHLREYSKNYRIAHQEHYNMYYRKRRAEMRTPEQRQKMADDIVIKLKVDPELAKAVMNRRKEWK